MTYFCKQKQDEMKLINHIRLTLTTMIIMFLCTRAGAVPIQDDTLQALCLQ